MDGKKYSRGQGLLCIRCCAIRFGEGNGRNNCTLGGWHVAHVAPQIDCSRVKRRSEDGGEVRLDGHHKTAYRG